MNRLTTQRDRQKSELLLNELDGEIRWRKPCWQVPYSPDGRTRSLPAWTQPQLAKLVEKAPDGPDWLHEIKFDGYRMHARLDAGRAQILTRRGNDWTDKYPVIAKSIAGLPAHNALTANFVGCCPMAGRPLT